MPKCETLRTEKMEQVKKVITVCVFNIKRYFRTHAWVVLRQQRIHNVLICTIIMMYMVNQQRV